MTEDYVSLYSNLSFSENGPAALLSLLFLFFGRMLPIIALAPFFGAKVLPHSVKVAFALCLFVIFLPQLATITKTPLGFNFDMLLLLFKELLVGILIGFFISLPFVIVQNTGSLIDHQRGASSLMVSDPSTQTQTSPLGTLYNLLLIYLFYLIDGPFTVIEMVSTSYQILPPDQFMSAGFFNNNGEFITQIIKLVGHVMILSTQLAAPALIMILMTDFFLGIANRLAPQVQITFLGMPLKSLLALMILFFGWQLFMEQMVKESYSWLNYLGNLIKLFKPA
ncbi:MAG: EscT/YscT/HrcT family type III secretion system export apparatus protein [Chlamydiales bacterium]